MKQYILILLLFVSLLEGFGQIYDSKPDALRNIEDGKILLGNGEILKAIDKFNFAINHGAEDSVLLLRAEAFLKLADTCNYCKDFFL